MSIMKLDIVQEILLTTIKTADIKNSIPLSLILVAPSGEAKSSLLKQHRGECIHLTDGFTQAGLWDIISADKDNKVKYIIVPDINPTLSRQPKVVEAAVANLLTLTFDGTIRMDDGRREKLMSHEPIGFIGAVTPEMYNKYAKKWLALGLRRRIIPIFYEYSESTTWELQQLVAQGVIHRRDDTPKITHNSASRKVDPVIEDKEASDLIALSSTFSILLGKTAMPKREKDKRTLEWIIKRIAPIDPHLTLRSLVRANAFRHGRGKVNQEDIQFAVEFLNFCDPEKPRQI
jgi:hypothetical protein